MIIDSHTHIFDRSVPGANENFPLWPGNRWGASAPTSSSKWTVLASIRRSSSAIRRLM